MRRHRVVALVATEVVAFDLAIPAQVFGREPDLYAWAVCAPEPGAVPTENGFDIVVSHGLEALAHADTVIVPGISDGGTWPPPAVALDALRAASGRGARVASICTGAFVLAAAGLLDGRRAATHWRYADALARGFPRVTVDADVLYVDDGDVLTSAGVGAGIDLCLHIVRRDHGAEAANAVARRMVVAAHRDGGQAQYVERPLPVAAAAGWARRGRGWRSAWPSRWRSRRWRATPATAPAPSHGASAPRPARRRCSG